MKIIRITCVCCLAALLSTRATAKDPVESPAPKLAPTSVNTQPTALDHYIAAPDASYDWKLVSNKSLPGGTVYVVDMVSQTWRTSDDVNQTQWRHWLTIVKPDNATSDTALLFISGGSNGKEPPTSVSSEILSVAAATNIVVAELKMVPNQPLIFHEDGEPRVEDNIIGYSWDQFMKTGDTTWPAQLPMTKSAIRAMDTVQACLADHAGGKSPINHFIVSGASKRGWTTWLTAATDPRVTAIAPIVIDVLNVNLSMQHHYSAYGFWAPAIADYVRHKITHRRYYPEYRDLLQIVDPFAYRDRLTMPKCIINATGDQFFLPDSSSFYFDELPGEKHLCYVPNADHSLRDSNAVETLASFVYCVANNIARPQVDWSFEDANSIRIKTSTKPKEVQLWRAENNSARDFRVMTIGKGFKSIPLQPQADGTFTASVEQPSQGWAAYFVECTFDVGAPTPLRLTTPVRIIPDVLPHEDKVAPLYDQPE